MTEMLHKASFFTQNVQHEPVRGNGKTGNFLQNTGEGGDSL